MLSQLHESRIEFFEDGFCGVCDAFLGHDVVDGGEEVDGVEFLDGFAGEWVDDFEFFDFVAEHFDAVGEFLGGWVDFDDVASDAELSSGEFEVVSGVLEIDESFEHGVAVDDIADVDDDGALFVVFG